MLLILYSSINHINNNISTVYPHISYDTCYYITRYIYHISHTDISFDTYIICYMLLYHMLHISYVICPAYHITHMLVRSHVLAHMPEQPFDVSFHTMQVGIENKYQHDQLDKKLSIKIYRYKVIRIHTDYAIN